MLYTHCISVNFRVTFLGLNIVENLTANMSNIPKHYKYFVIKTICKQLALKIYR